MGNEWQAELRTQFVSMGLISHSSMEVIRMALADPQSITVNAVAKSMPRILNEGTHSLYQMSDQTFSLDVRHRTVRRDKKSRTVSLVAFTQKKVVADPLTAVNDYEFLSWSVQLDRPDAGFTSTECDQQWAGFKTWFDTTMVGKIFGRES